MERSDAQLIAPGKIKTEESGLLSDFTDSTLVMVKLNIRRAPSGFFLGRSSRC